MRYAGATLWRNARREHFPTDPYQLHVHELLASIAFNHEGIAKLLDLLGDDFNQLATASLDQVRRLKGIGETTAQRLWAIRDILFSGGVFLAGDLVRALNIRDRSAEAFYSATSGDLKQLHYIDDLEGFRLSKGIQMQEMGRLIALHALLDKVSLEKLENAV